MVSTAGQRVSRGGQDVSVGGHFGSAGGQRVTMAGQRVACTASAVTRGGSVVVSERSAKKRSSGLAIGSSTGTVSPADGIRTRKNRRVSEEGTGKGLAAFHKSSQGPSGLSDTWRTPSPFQETMKQETAMPTAVRVGQYSSSGKRSLSKLGSKRSRPSSGGVLDCPKVGDRANEINNAIPIPTWRRRVHRVFMLFLRYLQGAFCCW